MYRVGQGFDVHKFVENRDLILGGIKINFSKGLLGHSDADVLTHAIMDALLGALCLGDIGKHFPDTDNQYKNANSIKLLEKVYSLVNQTGFELVNLDSTIICEKPKISPYTFDIQKNLADTLKTDIDQISIKATTTEKLGFTGREEGIASQCIVLLKKINY